MNNVTELIIKNIHPKWKVLLNTPFEDRSLMDILDETIIKIISTKSKFCPNTPDKVLRCLRLDPDLIKVVVLAGDPYPEPGIATGLAFAVDGESSRPGLNVLLRELWAEYTDGFSDDTFDSSLEQWEKQGVLLLNSALSCELFKPGSHYQIWEPFITGLLRILNDFKITRSEMTSLVFVFIGAQANLFQNEISDKLHYKITRYHPTAETHGSNKFKGFFKEVNTYLEESGQTLINWYERI